MSMAKFYKFDEWKLDFLFWFFIYIVYQKTGFLVVVPSTYFLKGEVVIQKLKHPCVS